MSFGLVGCVPGSSWLLVWRVIVATLAVGSIIVNVSAGRIVIAATFAVHGGHPGPIEDGPAGHTTALRSTTVSPDGSHRDRVYGRCCGPCLASRRLASGSTRSARRDDVARPRIKLRHLRWAGPRLGLLALGVSGGPARPGDGVADGRGQAPPPDCSSRWSSAGTPRSGRLTRLLAPVLRGGGHVRSQPVFALTRSRLAGRRQHRGAGGAHRYQRCHTITGIAIWLVDTAVRAGRAGSMTQVGSSSPTG